MNEYKAGGPSFQQTRTPEHHNMSSKRQRLGPCAECTLRERTCDGLYPECDYYRRSMPGPNLRPRQARIRNEQQYLSERVRELEAELERLSGTTSGSLSPPTSGGSPERSGEIAPLPPFDQPPAEMSGEWWLQDELVPANRDYLLKIFFNVASSYHLHPYHPTFQQRLASGESTRRPHPSLLNAMYLIACASTYALPQSSQMSLTPLEDYFLDRTRKSMSEGLANADRLLDYLEASSALSAYLNTRNRHLEGYHHHCGAARLALACDLHTLPSPASSGHQPPNSYADSEFHGLVGPPTTASETAERIHTFWNLFVQDRIYATVYGLAPALDEETDHIRTPLPLQFNEDGNFNVEHGVGSFISNLMSSSQDIKSDWLESAFAVQVVSLAILHKAKRTLTADRSSTLALLICSNSILDKIERTQVDRRDAHFGCMHDIAHLTAMELLKSLTETETLEDKSILRHAQSIYESASDFPKRELVRACPLRRFCWQEVSAWLTQYKERILPLRTVDDPDVATIKSRIFFLESAISEAQRR